jgi:hypothetical protein
MMFSPAADKRTVEGVRLLSASSGSGKLGSLGEKEFRAPKLQ